ncbi:cobalamin B12-binding domain-containing protein [Micromonospora globispora]|uniref:cobalamin B12-binding domain-containing protein n=1 Tax=Micromonospora globispora TaxID=1450148 RepID=UPI001FAFE394|nr:B12-binding domain-containing protein [Micromonospora globispora]
MADVLVDLVAVAEREIGRRWLTGTWSVAQEHAATHVSELVVGTVAARHSGPADRGHVVMACVEGEWHALAARIVAEVVRAAGWRATFLAAGVPARHLVSYLLAAAIRVGDPQLLLDFVGWQDRVFSARGGRPLLDAVLASCETALAEHPRACHHLRLARSMAGPA